MLALVTPIAHMFMAYPHRCSGTSQNCRRQDRKRGISRTPSLQAQVQSPRLNGSGKLRTEALPLVKGLNLVGYESIEQVGEVTVMAQAGHR